MADDGPSGWEQDQRRSYTPADTNRTMQYVTYRHESGDLRLRIAPASLDGDDRPGYTLRATTYPGLDFSESTTVRYVLRFERCVSLAERLMSLFDGRYDGPGTLEDALEYASVRVSASDANDSPVDVGDER